MNDSVPLPMRQLVEWIVCVIKISKNKNVFEIFLTFIVAILSGFQEKTIQNNSCYCDQMSS